MKPWLPDRFGLLGAAMLSARLSRFEIMIEVVRTAFEDSVQRAPSGPISSIALVWRWFTHAGANAAMASIALACLSLTGGGANAQVDSEIGRAHV